MRVLEACRVSGSSPNINKYMKLNIRTTIENWPRKNAMRAFMVTACYLLDAAFSEFDSEPWHFIEEAACVLGLHSRTLLHVRIVRMPGESGNSGSSSRSSQSIHLKLPATCDPPGDSNLPKEAVWIVRSNPS